MAGSSSSSGSSQSTSYSDTYIPDYLESPILREIATHARDMSDTVYNWGMERFNKNQGDIDGLMRDALSYASPQRIAVDMGMAEAGVQQGAERGRQSAIRDLESYGIDPSSGRYAALDSANRVMSAATAAGAGNQQRMADQAAGNAMRNQAIAAGLQNSQFGLGVGNSAKGFLDTAMQLKYPPLGRFSSSQSTSEQSSQSQTSDPPQKDSGGGAKQQAQPSGGARQPSAGGAGKAAAAKPGAGPDDKEPPGRPKGPGGPEGPGKPEDLPAPPGQDPNDGIPISPGPSGAEPPEVWGLPPGSGAEPPEVWGLPPGSGAEPPEVWGLPPGSGAEPSEAWTGPPDYGQDPNEGTPVSDPLVPPDERGLQPPSETMTDNGQYNPYQGDTQTAAFGGGAGIDPNTGLPFTETQEAGAADPAGGLYTGDWSGEAMPALYTGEQIGTDAWSDIGQGNYDSAYDGAASVDEAGFAGYGDTGGYDTGYGDYGDFTDFGDYGPGGDYGGYDFGDTGGYDYGDYGDFSDFGDYGEGGNYGGDEYDFGDTGDYGDYSDYGDFGDYGEGGDYGGDEYYDDAGDDSYEDYGDYGEQGDYGGDEYYDASGDSGDYGDYGDYSGGGGEDYYDTGGDGSEYDSGYDAGDDYSSYAGGGGENYYDASGGGGGEEGYARGGQVRGRRQMPQRGGRPRPPMRTGFRPRPPGRGQMDPPPPKYGPSKPRMPGMPGNFISANGMPPPSVGGAPSLGPTAMPAQRPQQPRPQRFAGGGQARGQGGRRAEPTQGGFVSRELSPSGGSQTDDVDARLNAGEFVIPKDVATWKGKEFFYKMIAQARKLRAGGNEKPQVGYAAGGTINAPMQGPATRPLTSYQTPAQLPVGGRSPYGRGMR